MEKNAIQYIGNLLESARLIRELNIERNNSYKFQKHFDIYIVNLIINNNLIFLNIN